MDFIIRQDANGAHQIVSVETKMPVSIDMTEIEAIEFLQKMITIKARSLKPDAPRLYYNRVTN